MLTLFDPSTERFGPSVSAGSILEQLTAWKGEFSHRIMILISMMMFLLMMWIININIIIVIIIIIYK